MMPSGAVATTRKTWRRSLHRLVWRLFTAQESDPFRRSAMSFARERIVVDPDVVRVVERLVRRYLERMIESILHLRRDVLDQRSATGHIQHLDAAADCEDRHADAARFLHERNFELVAFGRPVDCRCVTCLAVTRRRDVVAAGEQQLRLHAAPR
jgi:hypothetical protein